MLIAPVKFAQSDLEVYDAKSLALRSAPAEEWGTKVEGDARPDLFVETTKPFYDATTPLPEPVSPGHIHMNFCRAHECVP